MPKYFYGLDGPKKLNYIYDKKLLHNLNGPAKIDKYGSQEWWLNGLRHRLDGPAIIYSSEYKRWYLDSKEVKKKIYKKIENSSKEELLMYAVLPKYKDYLSLIDYVLNKK